jgi:hypothetical protein
MPASTSAAPSPTPPPAADEEHTPADYTISGQTTFQDLLDWGVTQEAIESVIGGPMPDASVLVREHVTSQGLKFSEIKSALQAEVDKISKP